MINFFDKIKREKIISTFLYDNLDDIIVSEILSMLLFFFLNQENLNFELRFYIYVFIY